MAKLKSSGSSKRGRPALSPEARENQLIALAMDRAEEQLRDGTASSQVITHFLKLGTAKYELEKEKLRSDNRLAQAKAEALQDAKDSKVMYEEALKAMREYAGYGEPEDYEH